MDPGLIAIFIMSSAALGLFMGLARLLNMLLRRPLVNGAGIFFWVLLAAIIGLLAYQWSLPHVTERMARHAGRSVGTVLPILILAFSLGRNFRQRRQRAQGGKLPPTA